MNGDPTCLVTIIAFLIHLAWRLCKWQQTILNGG